mmetsp:Transcript_43562/g.97707  ORF Transcript_43562/g.97707 Transcript_43562/m.97707 type:complete len:246 (+) Transcript_43562:47-784(+)
MWETLRWAASCALRPDRAWAEGDTFETQAEQPIAGAGFIDFLGLGGYGRDSEEKYQLELAALAGRSQAVPDPCVVVFLDIDGVLHASDGIQRFTERSMMALRYIVLHYNATVVLSSAWRRSPRTWALADAMLRSHGLAGVADATPDLKGSGHRREDEILIWLKRNPEVCHWVALDDADLAPHSSPHRQLMMAHFVMTDPELGLMETGAARAMRLLQNPRGNVEESLAKAHGSRGATKPKPFQLCA